MGRNNDLLVRASYGLIPDKYKLKKKSQNEDLPPSLKTENLNDNFRKITERNYYKEDKSLQNKKLLIIDTTMYSLSYMGVSLFTRCRR